MSAESSKKSDKGRLGVVSYLNAKPLIAGLDADSDIELIPDVPARLSALVDEHRVDAALVPVIDLARAGRKWQVVSDACIGSDGETLTVRVFSRVPAESIRQLHVDGDSHTSVVLASVIWRELYGQDLQVVPLADNHSECDAILLIGDKVVTNRPVGYDIEIDLGSAWKSLTTLPFVFAVWAAPQGLDVTDLALILSRARDRGVQTAEMIAEDFAPGMGWPVELAKRYLSARIKFTLGDRQREAMNRFLELAKRHNLSDVEGELVFA